MNSGSSKGYNSHSLQAGVNKELLKKVKNDFWKKAESKGKYWELPYGSKYGYHPKWHRISTKKCGYNHVRRSALNKKMEVK